MALACTGRLVLACHGLRSKTFPKRVCNAWMSSRLQLGLGRRTGRIAAGFPHNRVSRDLRPWGLTLSSRGLATRASDSEALAVVSPCDSLGALQAPPVSPKPPIRGPASPEGGKDQEHEGEHTARMLPSSCSESSRTPSGAHSEIDSRIAREELLFRGISTSGEIGPGGRSIEELFDGFGLPRFKDTPGVSFTVRVRQHVNPLKISLAGPTEAPDWGSVFRDPSLPLFLDVGCASARLSLVVAMRSAGQQNVLGLEIREPLVERANLWTAQLGLDNAHFIVANATIAVSSLLQSYPGELRFVCVLCPDPHFKKRHRKRRIVQPALVEAVTNRMAPGGVVFLQSDILEVAQDMRNQFHAHAGSSYDNLFETDADGWVKVNPLRVPSEREAVVISKGLPVFRTVLRRRECQDSGDSAFSEIQREGTTSSPHGKRSSSNNVCTSVGSQTS